MNKDCKTKRLQDQYDPHPVFVNNSYIQNEDIQVFTMCILLNQP